MTTRRRATWARAAVGLLMGGGLLALPFVEQAAAADPPTFERTLVDAAPAAMYPSGLEYDAPLDRLVVADTAGDRILIYSKTGTHLSTFSEYGTGDGQVASPRDVAIDEQSNIYVADAENNRVQKFDANGTWLWSTVGTTGGCDLCLNTPIGVTWDATNQVVLVASTGQHLLKALHPDGSWAWTSPASAVLGIRGPRDVTRGPDGRIWVSDYLNHHVKAFDVSADGLTWDPTPAIDVGGNGHDEGDLNYPYNVVFNDDATIIYVSDTGNGRLARWDISGPTPVTLPAFGARCANHPQPCEDPPTDAGLFNHLRRVAIDGDGTLFAADFWGNGIEVFDPAGTWVRSIEGASAPLPGVSEAYGVAVGGPAGDVYVMDRNNHRIERFDNTGAFISAAGARGTQPGVFSWPEAVAVAPDGDVWAADTRGDRIQHWPADLATTPNVPSFGQSASPSNKAAGRFTYIEDLDVAPDGRVWVVDTRNDRLQIFDPDTSTFTLFGTAGSGDGEFDKPQGVAVNASAVYVADTGNNRIQKLDLDGTHLATLAGLSAPEGVAVAPDGTVWVADTGAHRVLHLSADLVDLGETFGSLGSGDEQLDRPHTLAATATELYVADTYNSRVQVFSIGAATGPDVTPPSGALTSPTPGGTVTDPTLVTGTASDDVGVTEVEIAVTRGATRERLKADGTWGASFQYIPVTLTSPGATSAEWSFSLDVPAYGNYGIMARARDAAGNVTVFRTYMSFSVQPAPDAVPPSGTLDEPTPGATVGNPVAITGTATDDVAVDAVDVAVQQGGTGAWLKPDGSFAPSFSWAPASLDAPGATETAWSLEVDVPAEGTYYVQARARDLVGNAGPFQSRMAFTVGVPPDTTPPDGTLGSPTPGGTITDPGSITGTASDDVGVVVVEVAVRRDGFNTWLRPDGSFAPGFAWVTATLDSPGAPATAWSLPLDAPGEGGYLVMARAADGAGNQAQFRSPMGFTVEGAPPTPLDPQYLGEIAAAGGVAPLYPAGGVTAPDGVRYIADSGGSRVVRMDAAGVVTALPDVGYNDPRDVDLDPDGTLWVANTSKSEVVHITTDGTELATLGGSGIFNQPYGIGVDAGGLYVADTYNHRVQRIDKATGAVVWTQTAADSVDLSRPRDVSVGSDGDVYVADTDNGRIVVLDPADGSVVRTFGSQGGGDGQFRSPRSVTSDGDGGIWVADAFNYRIQHLTNTGDFLGASGGTYGTGDDEFRSAHCVFMDGEFVAVCDTFGFRLQRYSVSEAGAPVWDSVLVGTPPTDGGFNGPFAVAYGPAGELFVVDWFNHRIEKFAANGDFVLAFGYYGTGVSNPNLIFPRGIFVSGDELIVTDSENSRIARFDLDGTFLGSVKPTTGGTLSRPHQTAQAPDGTFWVADTNKGRVVHMDGAGTVLHSWTAATPQGIAVDADGVVYVASRSANTVTRYTEDGVSLGAITTSGTGQGATRSPAGLLITGTGTDARLWIADADNDRVQVVELDGTFVAAFGSSGSGDGQFLNPRAVALNPVDGTIAVADHGNNRVSLWSPS